MKKYIHIYVYIFNNEFCKLDNDLDNATVKNIRLVKTSFIFQIDATFVIGTVFCLSSVKLIEK